MKKASFLTLFFIVLGVVFASAAWLRIRAVSGRDVPSATDGDAPATPLQRAANAPAVERDDTTVVIPAEEQAAPSQPLSAAARARDERYEKLLRAAPPGASSKALGSAAPGAPASKPAAEAPSLLDRVVKPIANALGINRSTAPQQPAGRPPSQTQEPSAADDTTTRVAKERDEDEDVTPPRLMAAEFLPPQLQDGETTIFAAVVTDDISGVKSVSGVVGSPSGAQLGFACQRDAESGRYTGRIAVPKEAAEGRWLVKYLTLTDNAGNTINLNSAQGTLPQSAGFQVTSSASDSRGPVLKAVWLDQQAMAAGEKNQVFVQADDDKSGVQLVSGVFVSPSKQARIGFGCRLPEGAAAWQCPVTPPACVDCGSWQLEQIQLQDKANNMTTVRAENPLVGNVRLELFGKSCDSAPPVVESVTVDPPAVSNADGGVVRVTAVATDDQCGVASLSGVAMPPTGSSSARLYFAFRPAGDEKTFVGEVNVPKHAPAGIWSIGWIQVLDKGHNLKAYGAADPVIAPATFKVE